MSLLSTFVTLPAWVISLGAVVPVLGVMIVVHELGHFLAAKFFGVRVDVFSIGFGKRLFGIKRGDTDYRVCLLPLGGYVKMAGDNPSEERAGDPREFLSKPRWQRFFIALMGPAFNGLLSVALLTGLFMFRYQKLAYHEQPALVGYVEENSAAERAGIRPGDLLVRVDGEANPTWETVELRILANPGNPIEVAYRRGDQQLITTLTPSTETAQRIGVAGWAPYLPVIVGPVEAGLPAEKAGIQTGDRIVAINGQEILYYSRMSEMVRRSAGQPLQFKVRRGNQEREITVQAVMANTPGVGKAWRIGVGFLEQKISKQLPFPQALAMSLETNKKYALLIFEFVGKLLERKMSPRSLEGPIGITRLAGDAARQGLPETIMLMAAISLNLGIFNLFPIPILDGGVILLLAIEGSLRRDLSLAVKERIVTAGFVFLVLFAAFVTYMDIVKWLPARFEKFLP
jgi:regulator of sigma E protease